MIRVRSLLGRTNDAAIHCLQYSDHDQGLHGEFVNTGSMKISKVRRMQQNICPTCDVELVWTGQYHCNQCDSDFKKVGFCPDCEAELEKLQACGAANYFCNTCNELKSKSRVRFEFQKIS